MSVAAYMLITLSTLTISVMLEKLPSGVRDALNVQEGAAEASSSLAIRNLSLIQTTLRKLPESS